MPNYTYIGPVTAITDTSNTTNILLPNTKVNISGESWLLRLKTIGLLRPIPQLMLDGSWTLNGQHTLDGETE